MKVLNKYFKVVLCFIAFALCSFMFAFSPTYTAVHAAEIAIESYKNAISALRMPTENVDYGSEDSKVNAFRIPLLESNDLTGAKDSYTIRVIDPAGYPHDSEVSFDGEGNVSIDNKSSSFFAANLYVATQDDEEKNGLIKDNKYLIVKAQNDGEYRVLYIIKDEANKKEYYSNVYKVQVSNVTYELDFSNPQVEEVENATADEDKYVIVGSNKKLIPTNMAVSSTPFELPVAYAKHTGKELTLDQTDGSVDHEVATIKVTKDGAPQDKDTSEFFYDDGGKYYIKPSQPGEYTIEYSYGNSENRPTKTFTINVEEGFVASDLKLASTPTMPTVELGKTIKLPKLSVNAGDEKNVETNVVSVVIEKEKSNGTIKCVLTNNNLEFVMSPENFGVTSYEDMVGNYRITYTVKDAHNKTLIETFKVEGVTVSTKPTIKLSYNYDTTKTYEADDQIFGVTTELEAEYESNTSFVLPAAYVEDAVTTDWNDFIIVRAIRKNSTYYYLDNKRYDEDKGELVDVLPSEKGYNDSGDENIGNYNKAVEFKFNTENGVNSSTNFEGTYYLEYRVISKEVKERENNVYSSGSSKYSFKVVSSLSTYKAPEVKITNLKDSSVKNTQDIIVKVSATDDLDTRLKTAVFTYTTSTGATETGRTNFEDYVQFVMSNLEATVRTEKSCHVLDDERLIKGWYADGTIFEDDLDDPDDEPDFYGLSYYFNGVTKLDETSTKNNFNLDLTDAKGNVKVVAIALNDGSMISADTKTLTIKDTDDDIAPEINIYASELPDQWKDNPTEWKDNPTTIKTDLTIGQGEKVYLPSVYVVDADKTLSLNVMYYINSPENSFGGIDYLSPSGKNYYYETLNISGTDTEVQVINGGYITTSAVGTYYVAYTATDVAGNTSIQYFTFEVYDTSKPILSVEPVSDDVTIAGNTVTGDVGTVIDFETTLKSHDGVEDYTTKGAIIDISVDDGGKGLDYGFSGNSKTSYVFNDYGTYTLTISATYSYTPDGKSEEVTLTADKKVIKVIIEKQTIKWLGEFNVPEYAGQGKPVILPDVAASNGAKVKVTYIAPGDSADEAQDATKDVDENGFTYWTFTTGESAKGTYKVIYTAETTDEVITKELSIKVGDNVAPTLTFNAGDLIQNYVYDGANDIEVVLEVNKKAKTFVVKVINNEKEVIAHDIGLIISDNDDTLEGGNINMSWTNLEYELTGDHVTKGTTTTEGNTTKTQYLINGVGDYSLKFKMTDSYDNVNDKKSIKFRVVSEASVEEKDNETVVGAVLIVISLVLLAGVILFFAFTGKKGNGAQKAKTNKVSKVKKETKKVETENVEETAEEVTENETSEDVESKEEVTAEETNEEEIDEEPKSGEVE